ncbi:MAG: carboxypeptidase regulatory-like domain-containing protein, partial [Planctomycetes bacterium]|nr:carboxypeptidase regulatory-like domain-containing protein [Planctomycetota bacterium]
MAWHQRSEFHPAAGIVEESGAAGVHAACEASMARKNLLLTVSLLVMVGALIGGILWTDPGDPVAFRDLPIADAPDGPADEQVVELGDAERHAEPVERADVAVPGPAVVPTGGARLRGRLVDSESKPRAGIELELSKGVGDSRQRNATTNADGEFEFDYPTDWHEGQIDLSATRWLFSDNSTRSMPFVRAGVTTELGDLVVIAASRIAGRVVDRTDHPLPGVTVEMRESVSALGATHIVETGADGRFEFEVEPCSGRLSTRARNYLPTDRSVTVERGVDRTDLVIRLDAGDSIAGRVVDDLGKPLVGARVAPFRSRKLDGNTLVDRIDAAESTTSDEAGAFVLGGIEPGDSVRLRAWADGHGDQVLTSIAAGRKDVTFRLVRHGSVRGVVVDANGEPIVGSQVETLDESEGMFGRTVVTTTDASGRFELDGVPAGDLRLRATGAHRPTTSHVVTVPGGMPLEGVRLVVDVGSRILVSVLDAENRPVGGARVRVCEASGESDAAARVFERRVERDGATELSFDFDSAGNDLGRGETDTEGRVEIGGLPGGPVFVSAMHDEYAGSRPIRVVLPRVGRVEARLTLREGGRVEVAIVDASGEPRAAGFSIRGPIIAGEPVTATELRSGADGIAVVGPLAAGSYEAVLVQEEQPVRIGDMDAFVTIGEGSSELEGTRVSFDVRARERAQVQLVFPVLTRVTGVVRDADGPVAGVTVRVEPESESRSLGQSRRATTDGAGRYEIADIASGPYTIRWGRPGATVDFVDELEVPVGLARLER